MTTDDIKQTLDEMKMHRDNGASLVANAADSAIHHLKEALDTKKSFDFQYHANQATIYTTEVRNLLKWPPP